MVKKLIALLVAVLLCISSFLLLVFAEEGDSPEESASGESAMDLAQLDELILAELDQIKYITNRPTAYTKETFDAYAELAAPVQFMTMNGGELPEEMKGIVFGLIEAREALQLADSVEDPEDTIWYIWGDEMAQAEDADSYDYSGKWDAEGFRPFLVP